MKPSGQCFEYSSKGYFEFNPNFGEERKAKLLLVFSDFLMNREVFDSQGRKWVVGKVIHKYEGSRWAKLLTCFFFNPIVDIEIVWRSPTNYKIAELKSRYLLAIELDDDILTQFMEKKNLLKEIDSNSTFSELAASYKLATCGDE